jgi:transposase
MNIHSNARTCPKSRAELVRRVRNAAWSASQAAHAAAVSVRTTYKWLRRHDREGEYPTAALVGSRLSQDSVPL